LLADRQIVGQSSLCAQQTRVVERSF
jgi:hypothetical protein